MSRTAAGLCLAAALAALASLASSNAAGAVAEIGLAQGAYRGGGEDVNVVRIFGTYYLGGLREVEAPLDLRAFLQRTDAIDLDVASSDGLDLTRLDISGTFFIRDLSLAPRFRRFDDGRTFNFLALDVGFNVLDNLRVSLPNALFGYLDSGEGDLIDTDISFRSARVEYVHKLRDASLMLGVIYLDGPGMVASLLMPSGFAWVDAAPVGTYLEARYYPREHIGIGVVLNIDTRGGFGALHLGGSLWISPAVRVSAGLTFHAEEHVFLGGMTALSAGVRGRF